MRSLPVPHRDPCIRAVNRTLGGHYPPCCMCADVPRGTRAVSPPNMAWHSVGIRCPPSMYFGYVIARKRSPRRLSSACLRSGNAVGTNRNRNTVARLGRYCVLVPPARVTALARYLAAPDARRATKSCSGMTLSRNSHRNTSKCDTREIYQFKLLTSSCN